MANKKFSGQLMKEEKIKDLEKQLKDIIVSIEDLQKKEKIIKNELKELKANQGNSSVKASLTMDENSCSNTPLPPAMEESKGTLSNCKHCNYLLSILRKRDNEITSLSTTLEEYKSTLKERDDEITSVKNTLVQRVSILNQKDKEIASLNASLKQTVSILIQRDDEIAKLNSALEQKVSKLSQREDEIARLNAALEQKVSMLSQREDEIARLNASLEQKVSMLSQMDNDLAWLNASLQQKVSFLSQKKNQIALPLKERENLKNAGRLCENDCVLCCFVDICKTYISDLPSFCGRSLEKQITAYAVGKKLLDENDLNCLQLMNILQKTGLVHFRKCFEYPIDPLLRKGKIKEAWLAMMKLSFETSALLIGRLMFNGPGHCEWFCRDKNTIFDSQSGVSTKANFESFYIRVQHDKGIAFLGFNISRVEKFINENRNHLKCDSFHDLNYQRVDYGSGVFRETVLFL
ncbi:putative leucine-rich repeat-containing protein DDB_G0290503 [Xenia sp. Carnegie-2017]|uniref:putative leucine-rich repeat-containing protein DDB_G0290503 n=1 Tax=Xenia sp. Carnegie-2017 TaxID=2897299 RepID=UPI001F03C993|nr:putative leucine-rich repeat-containing protein DDB_G0290503 [Xenia sp. Carnegie-2017]